LILFFCILGSGAYAIIFDGGGQLNIDYGQRAAQYASDLFSSHHPLLDVTR